MPTALPTGYTAPPIAVIRAGRFNYEAVSKVRNADFRNSFYSRYATIEDEIRLSDQPNPFDSNRVWGGMGYMLNKHLGGELLWMTQFDGGPNRSNYVAFILRHDFGWSADRPERRPRFLPQ